MYKKFFNLFYVIAIVLALGIDAHLSYSAAAEPMCSCEGSFSNLVERVKPATVSIKATLNSKKDTARPSIFDDFPEEFRRFLPETRPPLLSGSGCIVDKKGIIITNSHVIEKAEDIMVKLDDGSEYVAKVLGSDQKTDLAVLKIDAEDREFPYAELGDSDAVKVGDRVIAIGNAFDFVNSVTSGIISAKSRSLQLNRLPDFIQTDAPINKGNSGGPLFNMSGEIIGINTSICSPSGGSVGIGFAIPSNLVLSIFDQLKDGKEIKRGWLGVIIQPVTNDIAESLGLSKASGALVTNISDNSPAKKANIQVGDIITHFNDKEISDINMLSRSVANASIGTNSSVMIFRNGQEKRINVIVEEVDEDSFKVEAIADNSFRFSGMVVSEHPVNKNIVIKSVPKAWQNRQQYPKVGDSIMEIKFIGVTYKVDSIKSLKNAIDKLKASIKGTKPITITLGTMTPAMQNIMQYVTVRLHAGKE